MIQGVVTGDALLAAVLTLLVAIFGVGGVLNAKSLSRAGSLVKRLDEQAVAHQLELKAANDATNVYKNLAEAHQAAERDAVMRITALEARMEILQGQWMQSVADGITRGVVESLVPALHEVFHPEERG